MKAVFATVVIIAATLVASVAVGGFVFGYFAKMNYAQVNVTSVECSQANQMAVNCVFDIESTNSTNQYVALITMTWAGRNWVSSCPPFQIAYPKTVAGCSFTMTIPAVSGQQFTGVATLSGGAQLLYSGTFK